MAAEGPVARTADVTGDVHEIGEELKPLVILELPRVNLILNARIRAVQPVPAERDLYPRVLLESFRPRRFQFQTKARRVGRCFGIIARNRVGGNETDFDPVRPGAQESRYSDSAPL